MTPFEPDRVLAATSAPFRLDLTVWALRRRPHNRVDAWDGRFYRRALTARGAPLEVCISQRGTAGAAQLDVIVSGARLREADRSFAACTLDRMLGLSIELQPFYALAAADDRLAPLAERFRWVKPVRFPSVFESLVNAVACQQLSLDVGIHLLNALALRLGALAGGGCGAIRAFPRPEVLAQVPVDALRPLGFSRPKAQSMIELSAAVASGALDLEALAGEPDAALLGRLQALRGIGRWSAEYALLRGYGRLDRFPADDVGAWHGLKRWLALRAPLDYERAKRITRRFRPYAGFVYFHLLLQRLCNEGHLALG